MWALRRHGGKLAFGAGAGWALDQSTLQAQEPALPKFSMEATRFDEKTFNGRLFKMLDVIDPRMLQTSEAEIRRSVAMLEEFKRGESTASNEELWNARKIQDVCVHPITGETLFAPGRMSAFIPCNVPIVVGMLSSTSTKQSVFWQWVNQSYNVMNNYVNRSSESVEWSELGKAYGLACSVSMGMALTFGAIQKKLTVLKRLGPLVPYSCVVMASSANIMFTRMDEIKNGVSILDSEGKKLGLSCNAGMEAIKTTIMTRTVCLPIVPIMLPGIVMGALNIQNAFLKIVGETVLVTGAFGIGLPVALAILPQEMEIPVSQLEPEYQGLKLANGQPVTVVFANKGL